MGHGVSVFAGRSDLSLDTHVKQKQLSKNLFLCAKAASLCKMVYRNVVRDPGNAAYEIESLNLAEISDYKIWTYSAYSEKVLDTVCHKPAVSAQCTTGLIKDLLPNSPDVVPFLCFGGTVSLYEVIADLTSIIPFRATTLKGNVIGTSGLGMVELYYTLRAFGLIKYIVDLVLKHKTGLMISGHSIGGTAAVLFACELLIDYADLFDNCPLYLVTFGSPRIFKRDSALKISAMMAAKPQLHFLRVVNEKDIVPLLPFSSSCLLYHIGQPFLLKDKVVEVHLADVDTNFPRHSSDANFLLANISAHYIHSDEGYFERLVISSEFLRVVRGLDRKTFNSMNLLTQSISSNKVSSFKLKALRAESASFFHHFQHFFKESPPMIDCRIWQDLSNPYFRYPECELPEVEDKEDIGIALSGGGMRAACLALGWLRALHKLGILAEAKYISSNSGGAFVHVPMSYNPSDTPLDTFLGPYVPPEKCTIEEVENSVAGGHGRVLANNDFIPTLLTEIASEALPHFLQQHERHVDFWSAAVGKAFLQQHRFDLRGSSLPAVHGAHHDRIRKITEGWVDKVYPTRPLAQHPYPIVNGSVLVGSSRGCIPMEFTPLYFGIIPHYESGLRAVGGCLIEPHGFTSQPAPGDLRLQLEEAKLNDHSLSTTFAYDVKIPRPHFTVTMQEMVGISSSYLAQTKGEELPTLLYEALHFPNLPTFSSQAQEDHNCSREKFLDGGGCDNTSIIALLRRRMKFIIACVATNASVDSVDPRVEDANGHSLGNVAGLFGRQWSDSKIDLVRNDSFNQQRKVFPAEKWDELLAALRAKLKGYFLIYFS